MEKLKKIFFEKKFSFQSSFFEFQKIADGGPRRKTEKFWQIEGKKIIDLYELDNSKKKIFFEKKFSK